MTIIDSSLEVLILIPVEKITQTKLQSTNS